MKCMYEADLRLGVTLSLTNRSEQKKFAWAAPLKSVKWISLWLWLLSTPRPAGINLGMRNVELLHKRKTSSQGLPFCFWTIPKDEMKRELVIVSYSDHPHETIKALEQVKIRSLSFSIPPTENFETERKKRNIWKLKCHYISWHSSESPAALSMKKTLSNMAYKAAVFFSLTPYWYMTLPNHPK